MTTNNSLGQPDDFAETHLRSDAPKKALLVASTGGHLAQLARLSQRWNLSADSLWVTFRSPQSESLLTDHRVQYVPYIAPRGLRRAISAAREISKLLRSEHFDVAVSTGAAVALSALPVARHRSIPTLYIESVSRLQGPSLTGRLISLSRCAQLRTQHSSWSDDRWLHHPSVLSQFKAAPKREDPGPAPSVFVSLGTIKPYRFDSLIDAVLQSGLVSENTVWQVGETRRHDLPGRIYEQVPAQDFEELATKSDIVVTHAGVGTLLNLFEWGVHPVVVPRRQKRNEHVDDHQTQISSMVGRIGIATVAEAPDLTASMLLQAATKQTVERPNSSTTDIYE